MIKVYLFNSAIIATAVLIHYEFLNRFSMLMPLLRVRQRVRIVVGVLASLTAHAAEIWIFGIAYYFMDRWQGWGELQGNYDGEFYSAVYFSFTAFTTLGLGDIFPHGDIRFLAGLESLTGFVLITWTASFLYLEMTRYWGND